MRGETRYKAAKKLKCKISIHSPHARGDQTARGFTAHWMDFNPLPSCEGRLASIAVTIADENFNPLPSCEGRRGFKTRIMRPKIFQSTPLMRGETRQHHPRHDTIQFQSTPLMRGETWESARTDRTVPTFQSTPLMRGETRNVGRRTHNDLYFNPLPSCEGRLLVDDEFFQIYTFQSTPLMRGETNADATVTDALGISIHSPHARGDAAFRHCKAQ